MTNSPEDAELIVQRLPSDMGIHRNPRKGALNAPEEILEGLDLGKWVLIDEVFPNEFNLEETHERIYENTLELAGFGKPIVSIGGDHSVSFPVIKALKEENLDMKLVWLDAHLDLKEKVGDHVSHDVVVRELLKNGFKEDQITFVGTTEIDEDERKFLEKRDIEIFRAEEVSEFLGNYSYSEKTYLSVDIDVLRGEEAPGTGYPDGQLSAKQVKEVIEKVEPDFADLVEVAPPLDRDQKTLINSREILSRLKQVVR